MFGGCVAYLGVLLPGLIIVGLACIPYMDKNPKGRGYYTFKERKFAISTFLFGFLVNGFPFFTWGAVAGNPDPSFLDRVLDRLHREGEEPEPPLPSDGGVELAGKAGHARRPIGAGGHHDVLGVERLLALGAATVIVAQATRRLSGQGNRSTQPRCSSFFTTWESLDSEALTLPASSLMRRVRSSASDSIARHR